jgi:hypothetical protein
VVDGVPAGADRGGAAVAGPADAGPCHPRPVRRLLLGLGVPALLWACVALTQVKASLAYRGMALAAVAGVLVLVVRLAPAYRAAAPLAAGALGALLFALVPARNDRAWWAEQARHALGHVEGDVLVLENYRELRAHEGEPVRYGRRRVDLSRLRRVWFGMEVFAGWEGGAHTFLSFEVEDEPFIGVSVESRREEAEAFSAFRGLFNAYELVYVIGDEREVIGRRGSLGASPAYLYPTRTDPAGRRGLLLDIVARSTRLAERPEHYNTLTSNCTNNLGAHVEAVAPGVLPSFDLREVFPGFSDRLLYERGLLDTGFASEAPRSFEALRTAFRIDRRIDGRLGEDFSHRIRRR